VQVLLVPENWELWWGVELKWSGLHQLMVVQPAEAFLMVVRVMATLTWWVRLKVVGL